MLHLKTLLTSADCDEEEFQSKPLRVGLISLGCAKNLVDAEIMLGSLLKSGVEITNDAAQADAVIVNTCSFIDSAQEESVDTILESVELRDAEPARPGRDRFRLPAAAVPRGTAQTDARSGRLHGH